MYAAFRYQIQHKCFSKISIFCNPVTAFINITWTIKVSIFMNIDIDKYKHFVCNEGIFMKGSSFLGKLSPNTSFIHV